MAGIVNKVYFILMTLTTQTGGQYQLLNIWRIRCHYIDEKLAFSEYISAVCRKASSRAGVGRCATVLRTVPTIVTAHVKVVARGAKEMRNTQDTRTGFVSSNSGKF